MTEIKPWLWPDHAITKTESRKLREEHNKLVNSLTSIVSDVEAMRSKCPDEDLWENETEHWFGSFKYSHMTSEDAWIQWPNLGILIERITDKW